MKVIVDSFINGAFHGWNGETLFKLGNNEFWIQAKYAYKYHYAFRPKAKIVEEDGKQFLMIEGLSEKLEVRKTYDVIESQIVSDFKGWSGDTIFKLANNQVWQQRNYAYSYHYAYRPNAIIYNASSGYKLKVDGMTDSINVKKIR